MKSTSRLFIVLAFSLAMAFLITLASSVPYTPAPEINSTGGSNTTDHDLNCFGALRDPDGSDMNVTVRWYRNGVLNLTFHYNKSYENATSFNAVLKKGNLTSTDSWKCGMRLYDGTAYSSWANSTTITILSSPNVTKCAKLNNPNTVHTLKNSVTSTATCFNITVNNVTLDCQNWSNRIIYGDKNLVADYYGVYSKRNYTTLKNCDIRRGSSSSSSQNRYAIYFDTNSHGVIQDVNASRNRYGIYFNVKSSNNILENITAKANTQNGIQFVAGSNNVLRYIVSNSNTNTGILIGTGSNNTLDHITSSSSVNQYGVYLTSSPNSRLSNVAANSNWLYGIYFDTSSNNVVLSNITANSNSQHGIYITDSKNSTARNVTANSNKRYAIYLTTSSNNTFSNISIWNCSSTGSYSCVYLYGASSGNKFQHAHINRSSYQGIWLTGTGSSAASRHNSFRDMKLENIANYSVYLQRYATNNTFLNVSYALAGESLEATSTQLIRKWYYKAYVNDTAGQGIYNVSIKAYNSTGRRIASLLTNSSGWTATALLTDYVSSGGTRAYYSNYTVNANLTNYNNVTRQTNLTIRHNIMKDAYTLDPMKPRITIRQPWNKTYANNSIDFNITADEDLSWAAVQLLSTNHSMTNASGQWQYHNGTLADGNYQAIFWFNDTAGNWNKTIRWFTINTGIVAYLEVSLIQPTNNKNIPQNTTFLINATVICRAGFCGNVSGTVRYNGSSQYPDTSISTTKTKPLYITDNPNPRNCSANPLSENEYCNLTWTVNATGSIGSAYKIGVLLESNISGVLDNHTANNTIKIMSCVIDISLGWNGISFGNAPPMQTATATGNSNRTYNITVEPISTCNVDLYIRGTDFRRKSGSDIIPVENLSFSNTTNLYAASHKVSKAWKMLRALAQPGTNTTLFYWLDTPPVLHGQYEGNLTIQAVEGGQEP